MTIAVTLPVRIRIDPHTAVHHPARIVETFSAGFGRAFEKWLRSAVRAPEALPAFAAQPTFSWSGAALASVPLPVRRALEIAIAQAIFVRAVVANDRARPPAVAPAALPPIVSRTSANASAPGTAPAVLPPESRVSASWAHWLQIATDWDAYFAAASKRAPLEDPFEVQARAFADRLETAIEFVPDVRRIVDTGFTRRTGVEQAALALMCAQLDRGFILAFAEALAHRRFVDFTVDRAIVPLVTIAHAYLAADDRFPVPEKTRSLTAALQRAFPPTRVDQILGVPIAVPFARVVESHIAIANFRDALVAGGFDRAAADAFTIAFVHSLLEALVDEYRQGMDSVVERIAAIALVFASGAAAAPMAGVDVRRLSAEFDELTASIAGRTPQAAVESGREAAAVRKRLEKALLFVVSAAPHWHADVRPDPAGGFSLVLVPPPLEGADVGYYSSDSGRAQLRDLVASYARMCEQWRALGARGFVWRTGVTWLDGLLAGVVAELEDDDALFFAEPREDG